MITNNDELIKRLAEIIKATHLSKHRFPKLRISQTSEGNYVAK